MLFVCGVCSCCIGFFDQVEKKEWWDALHSDEPAKYKERLRSFVLFLCFVVFEMCFVVFGNLVR